jgi:2-polyprenyl-6-hydroxyphenyl methylase / 3-demethylubiquinone-9 3-methyltransferase
MEKVSAEVYNRINNDVYKAPGDNWWQPDTILHLLKTSINPWRVGYAEANLKKLGINPQGKSALEVGSGGGILTEEICRMGFNTTGIDPAAESVRTATNHATASGLNIKYDQGSGENLPYADHSFDCVFCCDVLEHVQDLPRVISEISRVLKPRWRFLLRHIEPYIYQQAGCN